jgi:hypothetical protein
MTDDKSPQSLPAGVEAVNYPTDHEAWLAEHKGPLKDTIAQVWWCGDMWCDCTQAQIVERYHNLKAPGWIVSIGVWEGEFHTDGEGGAADELAAKRAELLRIDPELAARIRWPNDAVG